MEKFKYEKYDYAKIGIKKKFYFQRVLTQHEHESLGTVFNCSGKELMDMLVANLKDSYVFNISMNEKKDYKIDDFDWEWKIITPEGTYRSNEASSKKE